MITNYTFKDRDYRIEDGFEMLDENKDRDSNILERIVRSVFQADIMAKSRKRNFVDARKAFSILLRDKGYTYTRIGEFLNKDHATILHHFNSKEGCLLTDKNFSDKYYECLKRFNTDLKKANRIRKGIQDSSLQETILILKDEIENLKEENRFFKIRNESLQRKSDSRKRDLNSLLNKYNDDNEGLYKLIDTRTKPGTQDLIKRKLNTLYNGVYSEVIECY